MWRPLLLKVPVSIAQLVPILFALIALQVILAIVALRDLFLPERRVRGGSKALWALLIIFGELFGPLIYLFFGREEG